VAFLAVDAASLPVSTPFGGNHTTYVALTLATNEAPRAAHISPSATPFNGPLSVTPLKGLLIPNISGSFPLWSFSDAHSLPSGRKFILCSDLAGIQGRRIRSRIGRPRRRQHPPAAGRRG
jgi:hypothetical protein